MYFFLNPTLNFGLTFNVILSSIFVLLYSSTSFSAQEINTASHPNWNTYPSELPQFDYSGDKLQQNWPQLAAATRLPWPNESYLKKILQKYPLLNEQLQRLAMEEEAPEELKAVLNNDFRRLETAVQHAWQLHYQGEYQKAYRLGITLGPAGMAPALYSKLIYTTHLVSNPDEKEKLFLEVEQEISKFFLMAQGYDFITFGDAYQKSRRLELMSTTAASVSNLLGSTQDELKKLQVSFPENPSYRAMLAGLHAGVIERVGNFVGSISYGADEDLVIDLFKNAIKLSPNLAVLHNEFAIAILRLDNSDYDALLISTLNNCVKLPIYSAEEALNQQSCKKLIQGYEQ
jgi:hypothetical protein